MLFPATLEQNCRSQTKLEGRMHHRSLLIFELYFFCCLTVASIYSSNLLELIPTYPKQLHWIITDQIIANHPQHQGAESHSQLIYL